MNPDRSRCNLGKEDVVHAIRDCQASKEVCRSFVLPELQQRFFPLNLREWLLMNLSYRKKRCCGGKVARKHGYSLLEGLEVEMRRNF